MIDKIEIAETIRGTKPLSREELAEQLADDSASPPEARLLATIADMLHGFPPVDLERNNLRWALAKIADESGRDAAACEHMAGIAVDVLMKFPPK